MTSLNDLEKNGREVEYASLGSTNAGVIGD